VLLSLTAYVVVYTVIYAFGFRYIYRLLRDGPADVVTPVSTPRRPILAEESRT